MHHNFSRFLFLFFCLMTFTSTLTFAGAGKPFNKIVFFGDSLSDDGNLYNYDFKYLPKSPPYFEGRFSNQYVWTDDIAKKYLEKYNIESTNFAFGGETAIFHSPAKGFLPYTLTMSRNSYLLRTAYQDHSKTLFVIWIGANDYLHDSVDYDGLTTQVIDSIKFTIENLISHGAMNFLVLNIPDIGKTPYAKAYGLETVLHDFSMKHNEKLSFMVNELQNSYKEINIHLYDVNDVFNHFIEHTDYYNKKYHLHLSNLTGSCWEGGYTLRNPTATFDDNAIANEIDQFIRNKPQIQDDQAPTQKFSSFDLAHNINTNPVLAEVYNVSKSAQSGIGHPCSDPDAYIFWDQLHPTKVVHQLFMIGVNKFIHNHYEIEQTS